MSGLLSFFLHLIFCLFFLGSVALADDGTIAFNNGDYKKALRLFTKSCDKGEAFGCNNLAAM